ncbi:RNA polymerase sigma factor [Actinoplanes sp. NPDC089786]|uniref:RNA polymerase sigma factor n=1 Tax=Actinoplanes sp. NPDC089786 TaxID=3155185 RepID=UPI00343222AE
MNDDVRATVDAVWRLESARIVAALMRLLHDVGLAEEIAQDALLAALEQWPDNGIPDNPGAWLTTIAKRRAVDHIRRARRFEELAPRLAVDALEEQPDDVLRLMFIACHPALAPRTRAALTLRMVAGLSPAEIARAFLTTEPVIQQSIAAAKSTLAEVHARFELPPPDELAGRLSSVLEVLYLIFNEGYAATAGDDLLRPELTREALRLARVLAELAPHEAEAHGLVALMEIQASRSAARTGPDGAPVRLHEQNRGLWDQLLIRRGFTAMLRARELGGTPGAYVLQAAIAVCHAQARTAEDTDWAQIATLYELLERLLPTPVVRLNRAVAVSFARDPAEALELVEPLLADPALRDFHLLPSVRADLLLRLGRIAEARLEFGRAADLAANAAERAFLMKKAGEAGPGEPTLGEVAEAFLARDDLGAATLRSYRQTMVRLRRSLGDRLPLGELTADRVARAFAVAWGDAAPATWNRHVAAARTFAAWIGRSEAASGLSRKDVTRAEKAAREVVWHSESVPLRERTLWTLIEESGAPIQAVLSLGVEDLDLADRRARAGRRWVTWRSGTARLLPQLLAERTRGPVFLADRRPVPSRPLAEADRCPETGRRRLSYERAEYLCKRITGHTLRRLKDPPNGQH